MYLITFASSLSFVVIEEVGERVLLYVVTQKRRANALLVRIKSY